MNKSGFTLVELLAVIALIAILSGIAIPNVLSSINNSRKNTFFLDAKRMLSKAEYLLSEDRNTRKNLKNGESYVYSFLDLNKDNEFDKDSDGGTFSDESFVKVTRTGEKFEYCICVVGSKRKITGTNSGCSKSNTDDGTGCLKDVLFTGIDIVKDKSSN